MEKLLIGFMFLAVSMLSAPSADVAQAQQIPVLEMFHGAECPHCHKERAWFPILKKMYPNLQIKEYEIWHEPKNRILMQKRLDEIGGESRSVPTNIIGDELVVGFNPEAILALMKKHYGEPVAEITDSTKSSGSSLIEGENNTLWIVLAIGLLIAIGGGWFVFGKEKQN